MAIRAAPLQVWIGKVEDRIGSVAEVLESLAAANLDLEFVLVRRTAEEPGKGLIFVAPVKGAKAEAAARAVGLSPAANMAVLRVEGSNKPGAGYAIARTIADAGISFRGLSATVIGKGYVCHLAFDSPSDASRAAEALVSSLSNPAKK
jgi:hypothetical protein